MRHRKGEFKLSFPNGSYGTHKFTAKTVTCGHFSIFGDNHNLTLQSEMQVSGYNKLFSYIDMDSRFLYYDNQWIKLNTSEIKMPDSRL